jgi:hypothetical protein
MSVSLKWWLAGRRFATVSKGMLTALALTALAAVPARSLEAASFDEPDQTESVLLHDAEELKLAAEPPAAAPPAAAAETGESLAEPMLAGYPEPSHTTGLSEGCVSASGQPCSSSTSRAADGLINRIHSRHSGKMIDSDPLGLVQRLGRLHDKTGACWSGRADLLLLWRNAPGGQPLITDSATGSTILDANQLDSALAAGPRFSLFRTDTCGHAWEATYLRAFNFRSQTTLPTITEGYDIAPPGILGDQETLFDGASMNLGSGIQSFELNRYHKVSRNIRLLGGFRWVEWRESATLTTAIPTGVTDIYQSNVMNSLYGGQIGFDATVLTTNWLRVDTVMKGGAYGNNVAANSLLVKPDAGIDQPFSIAKSPASCGFVGELGFTGVMPITNRLDFRFGYFGLWLQGLAQPTRQFLTQDLAAAPPTGTLDTKGGTVVQGLSLGLEGRW